MIPEPSSSADEPQARAGVPASRPKEHDPDEGLWQLDDEAPQAAPQADEGVSGPPAGGGQGQPDAPEGGDWGQTNLLPRQLPSRSHDSKGVVPKADETRMRPPRSASSLEEAKSGFEPLDDDELPVPASRPPQQQSASASAFMAPSGEEPPADPQPAVPARSDSATPRQEAGEEAPFEALGGEQDRRWVVPEELKGGWTGWIRYGLRGIRGLSLFEQVCWIVILLGICGFGAVLFFPAMDDLPDEKQILNSGDFPLTGKLVEVLSAESYWREPVQEGPESDIYRRGTALLPVVEMKLKSGGGVIRALFRDSDGRVVGDPVSRKITGEESMSLTGTTGFGTTGMYAAYRTGELEPWTIEVYEAASEDADVGQFKLLFEMNIHPILK